MQSFEIPRIVLKRSRSRIIQAKHWKGASRRGGAVPVLRQSHNPAKVSSCGGTIMVLTIFPVIRFMHLGKTCRADHGGPGFD